MRWSRGHDEQVAFQLNGVALIVGCDVDRRFHQRAGLQIAAHLATDLDGDAVTGGQVTRSPVHLIPGITEAVGQTATVAAAVGLGIIEAVKADAIRHPQHQGRIGHSAAQ